MASNILRNVEKFENQEWKFEGGNRQQKKEKKNERKLFSLAWLQSEKSIIYQKSIQHFLPVYACTL